MDINLLKIFINPLVFQELINWDISFAIIFNHFTKAGMAIDIIIAEKVGNSLP
jgi:hypothetical protein